MSIAASVVDLPWEPVGPVTSTSPARRLDSLRTISGQPSSFKVRMRVGMVRKTAASPVALWEVVGAEARLFAERVGEVEVEVVFDLGALLGRQDLEEQGLDVRPRERVLRNRNQVAARACERWVAHAEVEVARALLEESIEEGVDVSHGLSRAVSDR
ncbi:MAG: hypothetical protein U0235_03930 [Polyangiaceae bacterium]